KERRKPRCGFLEEALGVLLLRIKCRLTAAKGEAEAAVRLPGRSTWRASSQNKMPPDGGERRGRFMVRKIIQIDEEKCNGCGLCAAACHEGAIGMVDGKARLLRDDYCDGLGDCLPACPTGAIRFVEREAAAYDEEAVLRNKQQKESPLPCGCPGSQARPLHPCESADVSTAQGGASQLRQWPVQIKLVPVAAPYFDGADLLIAADCTAYAYANFHQDFIRGRITL